MSNPHEITLAEAITMTHAYANDPQFTGLSRAVKFPAAAYTDILSQPNCVGIRSYFAINDDALTVVMVGVDENGDDLTNGKIMERGMVCPTHCHMLSPLM